MKLLSIIVFSVMLVACTQSSENQQPVDAPVVIGVSTTLSGNAALYGESYKKGLDSAAAEINANGEKIRLIYEDNKNDPKEGIASYERLRLHNPEIIIFTASGAAAAAAPLVQSDGKPLFISLSIAPVNKDYPDSFRFFYNAEEYVPAIMPFLESKKVQSIALYYINNEAGHNGVKPLKAALERDGISIVAEETYPPTESDHSSALLKLAQKNPDAIYTWSIRSDQFATKFSDLYKGIIIYSETTAINRFYELDGFEGSYVLAPAASIPSTPEGQAYVAKFGNTNVYAGFGYDTLMFINNALENDVLISEIITHVSSQDSYSGILGPVRINEGTRQTELPLYLTRVESRTLIPVVVK